MNRDCSEMIRVRNVDIPWSELALVLAVQRHGSLRGAAKALKLSHPTVSRRVADLQDAIGVHLFKREGRKLQLTMAGEDFVQTAARVEAEVDGLSRRIIGRDHSLEGVVRIALSPAMLAALAPALPRFAERHPRIELEMVTGLTFAHLTRREADVAIRQTNTPHDTLVGRRLSLFEGAVYAHRTIEREHRAAGNDLNRWPWVDWDEAHAHHASARWMTKHIAPNRIIARCDSSLAMYQLVKAGVGVGFVPSMLAARDAELVRLALDELPVFQRAIWVLTHADLRNTGRVRVTVDWLSEVLRADGGGVWPGVDRSASTEG